MAFSATCTFTTRGFEVNCGDTTSSYLGIFVLAVGEYKTAISYNGAPGMGGTVTYNSNAGVCAIYRGVISNGGWSAWFKGTTLIGRIRTVLLYRNQTLANIQNVSNAANNRWENKSAGDCNSYLLGRSWTYKFLDPGQLSTPSDLNATNITSESATLNWSDDPYASNFKIEYKINGDTSWTQTTSD